MTRHKHGIVWWAGAALLIFATMVAVVIVVTVIHSLYWLPDLIGAIR